MISKKSILFSLALVWQTVYAAPAFVPEAPSIAAKAYVLMDADSGEIISASNETESLAPASLTKMMTSYVIDSELKQGNIKLDDQVNVSEKAWAKNFPGSSKMFIEPGKEVTVDQLRKGIIVQSGNDASVAIAEHIAGSEDAFAQVMNHHAKLLGLTGTHFVNSMGLPNPDHYTTAIDIAKLAQAIIHDFPKEYYIYAMKSFEYNNIEQSNRNRLLWDRSMNVDGLKTGHTEEAGYCLVASAKEDDMRLISVVMGADSENSRKQASKKLLAWGFRYYRTITPVQAGESLHQLKVWYGKTDQLDVGIAKPIHITLPKSQVKVLKAEFVATEGLEAPIQKGQEVGKLFFRVDGKDIKEVPLVALNDLAEGGFFSRVNDWLTIKVKSLL